MKNEAGQFSLAQMISESHNTDTIQYWLMNWFRSGAPVPNEIVTDLSRALLTAIICVFTSCKTLEEYCEMLFEDKLPDVFVRIDVAHFMKKYSRLFQSINRTKIKRFYLGIIGQLVVCQSMEKAKDILKSFFTVCYSDNDGYHDNGEKTLCATAKSKLHPLITSGKSF